MQQWTFFLNDVQTQSEPQGWDDLRLTIIRDKVTHGIFFEASTNTLTFYGQDADYLKGMFENAGFEANVTFRAESDCDETSITGRLDFGTYRYTCGESCSVQINLEREGCLMTLKNRMNQKVDLSSDRAFDKMTVLANYPGLNFDLEMLAQDLEARVEGTVEEGGDNHSTTISLLGTQEGAVIRPFYGNVVYNSISTGFLNDAQNYIQDRSDFSAFISPQILYEDNSSCFEEQFQYQIRLKGRFSFSQTLTVLQNAKIIIGQWNAVGNIFDDITVIDEVEISAGGPENTVSVEFDESFSGSAAITPGNGFYAIVVLNLDAAGPTTLDLDYEFDEETSFLVFNNKSCPPTQASVCMIHEAGSRIVEAITDGCMRMKSDYYGRTDSQPFAATSDGCGGLRAVTSGLRLRNAAQPKHFLSLNEFFNGLRAIDNIGMGIEDDPVFAGKQIVRIESVDYFYKDTELMRILAIPRAVYNSLPDAVYSKILIGYQKWEVERVNGLDEPNSNKEFRTSLTMIENEINLLSNFVSGGIPIEVTRQQSYADTGAADTTYDNETFIICLTRTGSLYYDSFVVEQGGSGISGVYSPATIYNWRIRPRFNLMRWWKSLIQSYRNLNNSTSRLFFMAGTGNLVATGQDTAPCNIAAAAQSENADMDRVELNSGTLPIWKPMTVEFEYPLSVSEYNQIKQNPYSYITFQCGNGDLMQGYIQSIEYTPSQGIAKFNLLLKWDTQ